MWAIILSIVLSCLSAPSAHVAVVAFGDSYTRGSGASSPDRAWIASFRAVDNRAVSGSRIAEQAALAAAYDGPATTVFWLTGVNDTRAATPPEEAAAALDAGLAALAPRRVYLALCPPLTEAGYALHGPLWNRGSEEVRLALLSALADVARQHPHVVLVDLAGYDPHNTSDLIHPDDEGHAQIARAFRLAMPAFYLPYVTS